MAGITGDQTRYVSLWTQHMTGVNRQFLSFERYEIDENLLGMDNYYTGGGLTDLRNIQADTEMRASVAGTGNFRREPSGG